MRESSSLIEELKFEELFESEVQEGMEQYRFKIKESKKVISMQVTLFDDVAGNPLALVIMSDITKIRKYEKH